MSLQRRVDDLTKIIRELLTKKKWERTVVSDSLWNKMIVISCVIAISLDPFFLYIPFIDDEKKCLGMDKKLRNAALILRSLTDITFLVDIGYQIYEGIQNAYKEINQGKEHWELAWRMIRRDEFAVILARVLTRRPLVTDLLSVFPMPQLLVINGFIKMIGPGNSERRRKTTVVNFFLLIQYLPRIYRIVLSSKQLTRTIEIRVKALFNLFLYFLASHVIGAFWYLFSIQRATSCWYQACQKNSTQNGCETFYCPDRTNSTQVNTTFFDEHCKIEVLCDTKEPFEYGIFLDSLKSGNAGNNSTFPTKLTYSFWWGLRNLSNFGTSLTTSNYVWENLFAILISITGVLLFIYLIGNIQTFIQMRTTQSEEIRKKIELKKNDIDAWMKENYIGDGVKKEIMKNINKKLEEGKDADLEILFNVLPDDMQKSLKRLFGFKILLDVELLELMSADVLKMMCDHLTPVKYAAGYIIFPIDQPIDRMLLIIQGTVSEWTDRTPNSSFARVEETTKESGRKVYGEELLIWASDNKYEYLRRCTKSVKCQTTVEGFALSAQDLQTVVCKCGQLWNLNFNP